ncbi:hypothetical protein BDR04DRAFT_1091174 [Suillus decipiens]|nr:hypothetical protein BDR04DRAFT_1091174 [Suillus decipiens]
MSTTETEDTSFKTVFLINLVVNKLKEANLTIAPPSAQDYVTYLRAVTEKKDLWLQVHLPCIKAVSPVFSISQTTSSRRNSTKRLLVTEPCTISWVTIGRIDHRVFRTKGLD